MLCTLFLSIVHSMKFFILILVSYLSISSVSSHTLEKWVKESKGVKKRLLQKCDGFFAAKLNLYAKFCQFTILRAKNSKELASLNACFPQNKVPNTIRQLRCIRHVSKIIKERKLIPDSKVLFLCMNHPVYKKRSAFDGANCTQLAIMEKLLKKKIDCEEYWQSGIKAFAKGKALFTNKKHTFDKKILRREIKKQVGPIPFLSFAKKTIPPLSKQNKIFFKRIRSAWDLLLSEKVFSPFQLEVLRHVYFGVYQIGQRPGLYSEGMALAYGRNNFIGFSRKLLGKGTPFSVFLQVFAHELSHLLTFNGRDLLSHLSVDSLAIIILNTLNLTIDSNALFKAYGIPKTVSKKFLYFKKRPEGLPYYHLLRYQSYRRKIYHQCSKYFLPESIQLNPLESHFFVFRPSF